MTKAERIKEAGDRRDTAIADAACNAEVARAEARVRADEMIEEARRVCYEAKAAADAEYAKSRQRAKAWLREAIANASARYQDIYRNTREAWLEECSEIRAGVPPCA